MNLHISSAAAAACLAVLSTSAFGQAIGVNINGEPVRFTGTGPRQVAGRVMVPVRGIFESLGAFVGYDPAARVVTASRGNIDISLGIGNTRATVNGRPVNLDVPAQVINGSTMVPLRFIGEALGAEVTWDPVRQAVNIVTDGQPTTPGGNPPTSNAPLELKSLQASQQGFVRAGQSVEFVLQGTPGAQATLEIPGVVNAVPMREASPGRYVATVTSPTNITVSEANAIARLRNASGEKAIQAGGRLSFDAVPPILSEFSPEPDARLGAVRPSINATFEESGSGIAVDTVRLFLDDRDVTREATVTRNFVAYRPDEALKPGRHQVRVVAKDQAGNELNRQWAFEIASASEVIKSIQIQGPRTPQPGDAIKVVMDAQAGGTATFSVGTKVRNQRMTEVSPGRYEGEYVVRRDETFRNERVTGRIRLKDGQVFTSQANERIGVRTGPPPTPTITSPAKGDTVGNELVIRGRAEPGTRVRVRVDYQTTLLGLFTSRGSVGEQTVTAAANGTYQTKAFNLGSVGRDARVTVTAVALGAENEESEAATIQIGR